ncbi:MAG: ABC transporter permease [Bacteroidales bacterium]|nr:ABC transporter permease [Bacteroidales bacterium]
MKNFKLLFVHEIHQQFKSFKFITMLMLAFIVSLLVSYVRINDYKEKYTTYQDEVKRAEEKLKKVEVYSELEVSVFVPPNPLSVFAKGIDDKIGNKAIISATHYPGIVSTSQKSNPFLNLFTAIDVVGVVKLFSVFIILMAAGAIAGEREDKTLKMIFVMNVGRLEFFLAKYLAFMAVILCSLLIIYIIPLLMIITDNQIATSSAFIPGVLSLLLTSLIYLSVFILLSLLVSAKMATAAQAVLTTLFIWLGITYIYPQITTIFSRSIYISPSKVELDLKIKRIDYELQRSCGNYMFNNQSKRPNNISIVGGGFDTQEGGRAGWIGLSKIGLTEKYSFEFWRNFMDMQINSLWERHRTVRFLEDSYNKPLLQQASFFKKCNVLMPDIIYTQVTEKLAGTDRKQREEQFRNAISGYRELFMDYIHSKDGLGYSFFTHAKEDMMKDDFKAYTEADYELAKMVSLDVSDVPEFTFHKRFNPYIDIIMLMLVNIILMAFGGALFCKSKIL